MGCRRVRGAGREAGGGRGEGAATRAYLAPPLFLEGKALSEALSGVRRALGET